MRRIYIGLVVLILSTVFTGCGALVDLPKMDEEQTALVTEYAAGLILKNNEAFKSGLLDDDELALEATKEAEARERERKIKEAAQQYIANSQNAGKKDKDNGDNSSGTDGGSGSQSAPVEQSVDNVASFYGLDGFNVSYKGYELTDSYPSGGEDMLMAMDASPGKQLCVINFDVTNTSAETSNFDMFYRKPNFYLVTDGGDKVHYQATLLLDDMAAYVGEIGPSETKQMVLVFEVDENVSSFGSLSLNVKNDSERGTMKLQ